MVEYEVGLGLILAPGRVRDERHRADTQDLRQRHHDERNGAGRTDTGNCRIPQPRDEIQVDQVIECLEHHSGDDGDGHRHQMTGDRALSQVLHGPLSFCFMESVRREAARTDPPSRSH
jgi:hypothetical protein